MPVQPAPGDLYVNQFLSTVLLATIQKSENFGAGAFFPTVPVELPSGIFPAYDQADLFRDDVQARAPGTEAVEIGWGTDLTKVYSCLEWAERHFIPDPVRASTSKPFDLERDATRILGQKFLIHREKRFVSKYMKTTVWSADLAGAASADATHVKYWNATGCTPVEDIRRNADTIESKTGLRPNILGIGAQAYTELTLSAEFLTRVQYGGSTADPATVDLRTLAAVFGVDKVVRLAGIENTAAKGQPMANAYIAGKAALLAYAPANPGIFEAASGYTIVWSALGGAPDDGGARIKQYRNEDRASDVIEGQSFYDMLLLDGSYGIFFPGIVQ